MDLPAFLLSKNFYSESIGMPRLTRDVSGGTYPSAFTCSGFVSTNPETRRGLAFQLCFAWQLRLLGGLSPLVTSHSPLPQNKKPGVERRVQPLTLEWLHAKLDIFLACTRKEPHLGLTVSRFAAAHDLF